MADNYNTTTASGKSPAFQFYPKDYLSDFKTRGMSFAQRGMYWELVSHCWLEDGLPSSPEDIAQVLGLKASRFVQSDWPVISRCFVLVGDRYQHPRLNKERASQQQWREKSAAGGRKSQANRHQRSTTLEPPLQPNTDTAVSSLLSPISRLQTADVPPEPTDARSKRPIFKGQRFVVFEWMLDDLRKLLGSHFDAFDVHSWFYDLDAKAAAANVLVPQRDGGKWLQEQTTNEAARRGMAVATAHQGSGKTAGNAAAVARFIARGNG